jgi:outer membrane protein OmpA-like peptidoglycan-associated protein
VEEEAMRRRRSFLFFLVLLALAGGCRKKPVAQPTPPPPKPAPQTLYVLLPESSGKATAITVTNTGGTVELNQPYLSSRTESQAQAPSAPAAMTREEVRRIFGEQIDAMPLAPVKFTLYFPANSDTLVPESHALIPALLEAVRERRSNDIGVIGHTDTTGAPEANYRQGLQRAQVLASILRQAGVAESSLRVASHGEGDLLVKTADEVDEPRNRRVEVEVR